jgi:hypothetical protein
MTTEPMPTDGDPRRLLSDVRSLAHQVRVHQRLTWVALAILAAVSFVAIPIEIVAMWSRCSPDGAWCEVWNRGGAFYWPPALLLAYAAIAFSYVRVAQQRGVGARVMPYAITGTALTVLFTLLSLAAYQFLHNRPPMSEPFPAWVMVLDRLLAPAGTIGIALLVLARLERNVALFLFTLVYLTVVLVPIDFGWQANGSIRTHDMPQEIINGTLLLLAAIGFRRWQR